MNVTFCPTDGDPCRKDCDKVCSLSGEQTGQIPYTPSTEIIKETQTSAFESWWKEEKHRPPYTNPKAIAKSAWDAARKGTEPEVVVETNTRLISVVQRLDKRLTEGGEFHFHVGAEDYRVLRDAVAHHTKGSRT